MKRFNIKKLIHLQPHLDPSLQRHWNAVQIGLFLLPFSSFLGGVPILVVSLAIWKQHFSKLSRERITQGFALLSILMIVTACFGVDRTNAFLGLFNFLPFFVAFPALSFLIQTPAQLRRIAWILVLTSIPVSLIGFGQLYLNWGGYPSILWGLLQWTIDPGGTPPGRMASIFTYANVLAAYYAIVFVLGIGLWIEQPGSRFLVFAILLDAIALILTNSRNVWAIALFACLAFALYQGWNRIVAIVGGIGAIMVGAAFAPMPIANLFRIVVPRFFWARLNDQMYSDRPIAQLRSTQWKFAWSMAENHPFTGWGLRSFTQLYLAKMNYWLGHPHNLFLMMSAETGFIVTALLYGLVGWIVAQGVLQCRVQPNRMYFTFLIAFAACTLFSFLDVTLFDARINLIGWIVLAGIWGIAKNKTERNFSPS